jgi:hypothetical protein
MVRLVLITGLAAAAGCGNSCKDGLPIVISVVETQGQPYTLGALTLTPDGETEAVECTANNDGTYDCVVPEAGSYDLVILPDTNQPPFFEAYAFSLDVPEHDATLIPEAGGA